MTNLDSSVPAAISGLLTDLNTVATNATLLATLKSTFNATNTPQIIVIDGQIGTDVPATYIMLAGVTNWHQQIRDGGNLRRDESYDIDCVINVYDGGDGITDASRCRSAVFSILSQIVQSITADFTLGGAVRFAELVSGTLTQGVTDKGGWAAQLEFSVGCQVALER